MKTMKKKGFTLVELLVVIAIIAILATVSVVGYTTFINKANMSADQQAVEQMNTMLEALDVSNEPKSFPELVNYLNQTGLSAEDYKPLSKGHKFVWDQSLNRILLVKNDNTVVYPEAYIATADIATWVPLVAEEIVRGTPPTISDIDGKQTVAIGNASDLVTSIDNIAAIDVMNLNGKVNLMGSAVTIPEMANGEELTISGGQNGATLANMMSSEHTELGNDKAGSNAGQKYATAFVPHVAAGTTLTIENVVFDGLVLGADDIGSVGAIVGRLNGTLILRNVTLKNCTVYGQNKVGIIAGYIDHGGELVMDNVTIENCTVNSVEGEAGTIFGILSDKAVGVSVKDTDNDGKFASTATNTNVQIAEAGNHKFVTINGVKYITKTEADGSLEVKDFDGTECTAVCKVGTKNTLGWLYEDGASGTNGKQRIGDTNYFGRAANEVATIENLTVN